MELRKNTLTYAPALAALLFLLILGAWWSYLLTASSTIDPQKLITMIKWEGSFFLAALLVLSFYLVFFFLKDRRKSLALQAFFSSLTHELKTPVASIKLQAEVMDDLLDHSDLSLKANQELKVYIKRLITGSSELEHQIEKTLLLARVEQKNAQLSHQEIDLIGFLKNLAKSYPQIKFEIDSKDVYILADELYLKLLFKNLFENTMKHCQAENKVLFIKALEQEKTIELNLYDNGLPFKGDPKKIGNLFYKYHSPTGTGVGLYLVKKLTKQMQGHAEIKLTPVIEFNFSFKKASL